MKDKVIGFEGLSGDEFLTCELAARLTQSGVIEYQQNKSNDKVIMKG
jgi:hypothetical protein